MRLGYWLRALDRRVLGTPKPATLRSDLIREVVVFGFFALLGLIVRLAGRPEGGDAVMECAGIGFVIWTAADLRRRR